MNTIYNIKQFKMFNIWRFLLLIFFGILVSPKMQSQVNVTPGFGNYSTLREAFFAINAGLHTGAVVISLSGSTNEFASAFLNASGVINTNYTSVTIRPSGTGIRTISGNFGGPLIDLNGADNVTIIDDSPDSSLVISNTSTAATASTIRFTNDASNNTINNITLQGSSGAGESSGFGVVYFATGTSTGNDNNTISNCNIGPAGTNLPINGIYSLGSSATIDNNSNSILNNNIFDYFNENGSSNGINSNTGNSAWLIQANRLYQTQVRNYLSNSHNGILITSGSGYAVVNNIIGDNSSVFGSGLTEMQSTSFTGIRYVAINFTETVSLGVANSIQGNLISRFVLISSNSTATQQGTFCGISVAGGNNNIGTITGNTIGASSGVNSIEVVSFNFANSLVVGIHNGSTGTIAIQNNFIASLRLNRFTDVSGSIVAINITGLSSALNISNNTIGNTTPDNIFAGAETAVYVNSPRVSGIQFTATPSCTIENNIIRNLRSRGRGNAGFVRGIFTGVSTTSSSVVNIVNNTISNLTSDSRNTTVANGATAVTGIALGYGTNSIISGNTVHTLFSNNFQSDASYVTGIGHGNATNTTISRNKIYNLLHDGTLTNFSIPAVISGILIRSGTTAVNVQNNMISLGAAPNTNRTIIGIQLHHGSTPDPVDNIFHNTINIEGISDGGHSSFGIARTNFVDQRTVTVNIKNNLINNTRFTRSGGNGQHFAIANNFNSTPSAIGWPANASDNNVLNANPATIGHWGTSQNLAGWKAASAGDTTSIVGNPLFVSATDLNLQIGSPAIDMAVNLGITNDITGNSRPGLNAFFDIGAYEHDANNCTATLPTFNQVTPICSGDILANLPTSSTNSTPTVGTWTPQLNNTSTTTYTFIPTAVAGQCFLNATMTITVLPDNLITGNTSQSFNVGATLSDIVVNPNIVNWYASIADANTGSNALSALQVLTNGSTYYAVVSGACRSNPFAVTVDTTLSASDFDLNTTLRVYPNPFSNFINISIDSKSTIEYFDIVGKSIKNQSIESGLSSIDLSKFSSGIYIMKFVNSNNQSKIIRIVKN